MIPNQKIIRRNESGNYIHEDGRRSKPTLDSTLLHISSLLNDLNTDPSEAVEFDMLHSSMDNMLSQVSSRQMDLLGDLNSVLDSFRKGQMTPEQLEMMVRSEQERSDMIMNLASSIGSQLQELFGMIEVVIDHLEMGSPLPPEFGGNSMRSRMNLVFESVDSITRIIATPPAKLSQTIGAIQKDIALATMEVELSRKSPTPFGSKQSAASKKITGGSGSGSGSGSESSSSPSAAKEFVDRPSSKKGVTIVENNISAKPKSISLDTGTQTEYEGPQTTLQLLQPESIVSFSSPHSQSAASVEKPKTPERQDTSTPLDQRGRKDRLEESSSPVRNTSTPSRHGLQDSDSDSESARPARSQSDSEPVTRNRRARTSSKDTDIVDGKLDDVSEANLQNPSTLKTRDSSESDSPRAKKSSRAVSQKSKPSPLVTTVLIDEKKELLDKISDLEAKIAELEAKNEELASSRRLDDALNESKTKSGIADVGKSVKLAANRFMMSSKLKASKSSKASLGDRESVDGIASSENELNPGTKDGKSDIRGGPDATLSFEVGGGGFKELQSASQHPHYHPGSTVLPSMKKQSSLRGRPLAPQDNGNAISNTPNPIAVSSVLVTSSVTEEPSETSPNNDQHTSGGDLLPVLGSQAPLHEHHQLHSSHGQRAHEHSHGHSHTSQEHGRHKDNMGDHHRDNHSSESKLHHGHAHNSESSSHHRPHLAHGPESHTSVHAHHFSHSTNASNDGTSGSHEPSGAGHTTSIMQSRPVAAAKLGKGKSLKDVVMKMSARGLPTPVSDLAQVKDWTAATALPALEPPTAPTDYPLVKPQPPSKVSLSTKVNQMITFSKLCKKANKETSTDDLEDFAAAYPSNEDPVPTKVISAGASIWPEKVIGVGKYGKDVDLKSIPASPHSVPSSSSASNHFVPMTIGHGESRRSSPLVKEVDHSASRRNSDISELSGSNSVCETVIVPHQTSSILGETEDRSAAVCSPLSIDDDTTSVTALGEDNPATSSSTICEEIAGTRSDSLDDQKQSVEAADMSHLQGHDILSMYSQLQCDFQESESSRRGMEEVQASPLVNVNSVDDNATSAYCKLLTPSDVMQQDVNEMKSGGLDRISLHLKSPLAISSHQTDGFKSILPPSQVVGDESSFRMRLNNSIDPLRVIYDEFSSDLPDYFKSRLLIAMTDTSFPTVPPTTAVDNFSLAGQSNSFRQANRFFTDCFPLIGKLVDKASLGLTGVIACEKMLVSILSLDVTNVDRKSAELYEQSLSSLYRKLGTLEALKVFIEVQLGEYRAVFEGINVLSANTFPTLMGNCEAFKGCYDSFLNCQSIIVEVSSRVTAVKDRCAAAKLPSKLSPVPMDTVNLPKPLPTADLSVSSFERDYEAMVRLRDELKDKLQAAIEQAEDLELELMEERKGNDRTPGALLFYATLNDPAAIVTFHSIYNILGSLKGFVNCSEHLDFPTVRQRLKECISQLPIIDKFLGRYDLVHKRWTSHRMSVFLDRGLSGSASDSSFICPLCDCDNRLDPKKSLTILSSPGRVGFSPQKTKKLLGNADIGVGRRSNRPSALQPIILPPTPQAPQAQIGTVPTSRQSSRSLSVKLMSPGPVLRPLDAESSLGTDAFLSPMIKGSRALFLLEGEMTDSPALSPDQRIS